MTQVLATSDFEVDFVDYTKGQVIDFSAQEQIAYLRARGVITKDAGAVAAAVSAGAVPVTHVPGAPPAPSNPSGGVSAPVQKSDLASSVQASLNKADAAAPLASPAFTGTPTVPTAAAGTNTTQAASTAFVANAIAALVASSPSSLDTLNELAAALGNDPNFATTVISALAGKATSAQGAKADTALQPSSVADGTALGATRTLAASDLGARYISDVAGAITIPENLNTPGFWVYSTGAGAVSVTGGAITAGGNVTVTDRRVVNATVTPCLLIQRLGVNSFEVRGIKAA